MKTFYLYWINGKTPEKVEGTSIADAVNRAGYGGGCLAALDFYSEGKVPKYNWNDVSRQWEKI